MVEDADHRSRKDEWEESKNIMRRIRASQSAEQSILGKEKAEKEQ